MFQLRGSNQKNITHSYRYKITDYQRSKNSIMNSDTNILLSHETEKSEEHHSLIISLKTLECKRILWHQYFTELRGSNQKNITHSIPLFTVQRSNANSLILDTNARTQVKTFRFAFLSQVRCCNTKWNSRSDHVLWACHQFRRSSRRSTVHVGSMNKILDVGPGYVWEILEPQVLCKHYYDGMTLITKQFRKWTGLDQLNELPVFTHSNVVKAHANTLKHYADEAQSSARQDVQLW